MFVSPRTEGHDDLLLSSRGGESTEGRDWGTSVDQDYGLENVEYFIIFGPSTSRFLKNENRRQSFYSRPPNNLTTRRALGFFVSARWSVIRSDRRPRCVRCSEEQNTSLGGVSTNSFGRRLFRVVRAVRARVTDSFSSTVRYTEPCAFVASLIISQRVSSCHVLLRFHR